MAARSERDVILEHALLNEDNLTTALLIGAAYEELCRRVIAIFLGAVEAELARRLRGQWQVASCRSADQLGARDAGECVVATFRGHPANFRVVLGADEEGYPKRPYLAIRVDGQTVAKLAALDRLKTAVDEEYAPGKVSEWSFWYRYIDKAYSGWDSADALVRLYRKGDAVGYFVGHLEKLARALEKALDLNPAS